MDHYGSHLTDGVVMLTPYIQGDAPLLCQVDHDPEHRLRFEFPENFLPSLQHSEAVIARWERERRTGERFAYAVRDARTGELLGGCELRPLDGDVANLSYWTSPPHRRRGVACRSAALACRVGFEELGYRRLEVLVDADNPGSQRVATRSGFRVVGQRGGRILHALTVDEHSVSGAGERQLAGRTTMDVAAEVEYEVRRRFPPGDVAQVLEALSSLTDPPPQPEVLARARSRVQLAIVKLAAGNLAAVGRHLEQARSDWRDTLCAAGLESAEWPAVLRAAGYSGPPESTVQPAVAVRPAAPVADEG